MFFLSVTIEPEVDTPAVLRAYARRYGADPTSWAFLSGSPKSVQGMWQSFRLTVNRRSKGLVDHPSWTFLIDPQCMIRYRYLGGILDVDTILDDVRKF